MTQNEQAIEILAEAILTAARKLYSGAAFDVTRRGTVIGISGEKYTVRIDGAEYTVPSRGVACVVGDIVYVLFAQGDPRHKIIIAKDTEN